MLQELILLFIRIKHLLPAKEINLQKIVKVKVLLRMDSDLVSSLIAVVNPCFEEFIIDLLY